MKIAVKILIPILLLFSSVIIPQTAVAIVPAPKELHFNNQKFSLLDSLISIKIYTGSPGRSELLTMQIENTFNSVKGYSINGRNNYEKKIILGLPAEDKSFELLCEKEKIRPSKKIGREGYILKVDNNKIIIAANDFTGIFYGVQSLKQLIRAAGNKKYLRGVKIEDWPSLRYRGVLDDISRGPVPTIDFMKYQIRRFSELKINFLQYYTENVVLTKNHPGFAPKDGSVSIEQWKELAAYARKYQIMLAGNFQSFGHMDSILNKPGYTILGINGTLISPLLPASYKLLSDIYSEMVPAFGASIFNVDCDETFDLGKGATKKIVDSLGYAEVYYMHIMRLYKILKKLDVRMMMWGDILLKYPELLPKLPKDIIVATWTYDALDSYKNFIKPIKAAGLEFFVTPGVLNSNKLYPNYYRTFGNLSGFARDGKKYGALGLLNTVWYGGGIALFSNDWYGVAYGAEKSWNTSENDSSEFESGFNGGIYGALDENYSKAINSLEELRILEPTDDMNGKILFQKLLPDSGKTIRLSLTEWDKVLKITAAADSILSLSSLKCYSGDKTDLRFISDTYRSLALERFDLMEASVLYSKADSLEDSHPVRARRFVLKAITKIDSITGRFTLLENEFVILWLKEYHTYSLETIMNKYREKIRDYLDVKQRLLRSLNKFDGGEKLLPGKAVRLAITKLPGNYFREWLMINPLPNSDKKDNSEIDYLKVIGGEENATPRVTQEFYYDSVKYRWRRVVTEYPDIVNLSEIYPNNGEDKVMYAFANIDVDNDTTVAATAGCANGIKVFINGKEAYSAEGNGRIIPDKFRFPLALKKGRNNLMLKISAVNKSWGFTFRLPGSEVRNHKNRYRILTGEN